MPFGLSLVLKSIKLINNILFWHGLLTVSLVSNIDYSS